ncbi:MAG: tryptophan synthase subunit alpha [Nitrospirales bacterium]|nr:tryptophan synthase subunit alpha [Nitrospirales bacterium]
MSRIAEKFGKLKQEGRKAFIAYIMAGDPELARTEENVAILEKCGVDIIELGVPFSDPVADGPTIQQAAERALKAGVTLTKVISLVRKLRSGTQIPIVLMTYYNPVFKYGLERFVKDAVDAGVDGLIIPDLPPEEAADLTVETKGKGLDTIFLIAPTSTEERISRVTEACTGFVYYVSMTGITGSQLTLDSQFAGHIAKVRETTDKPIAIGFGVSRPEDARQLSAIADGIIVGSAIVKKFYEHPAGAERFIKELREAI